MLAQRLASESSWADRYIPTTPSETVMTPSASSVAGFSEAGLDEGLPTYESATSEAERTVSNPTNLFYNIPSGILCGPGA